MINIAIAIVLVVANTAFLALNILGLPGNWLMIAAAVLVAWWRHDSAMFSPAVLVTVGILAVVGEVIELLAGATAAKKSGGSTWAAAAALAGGIVGGIVGTFAILIPLIGTLLGACIGAAAGAFCVEQARGAHQNHSLKVGLGAGAGRLLGTVGKLAVGAVIWLIIAIAAFWP